MRIAWKLGDRLIRLDVENAREKVKARWQELRQTVYSDAWLTEHIDSYARQVVDSGAFDRDGARWVSSGHNGDYESLKKLACGRMAFSRRKACGSAGLSGLKGVCGVKRRKALFLNLILAAFCLAALFLWPLFMGPIAIHEGTKEEIAQLLATHREAEEPFFTDLAFSGEKLPYDEESSVFYLPLDMETEGWERGELASAAPGVSLVFEEDFTASDKQEAIRTGARFRFYAVQGEEYQECWLTATGLPVVSIETEASPDMEVFGGSVYFWDSGTKAGWASSSILEANIRGNTSRTYEKKGYKLNLKKQNKKGEIVEDKKAPVRPSQ